MKEEIIIINGEPFYRIPNGTSCDYAPIPKEFKPYFEKLEEENKSLQSQLKAKEDLLKEIIEWLKYKAEQLDTFDIPKRKETGAFWFATRGEIDGILSKGEKK